MFRKSEDERLFLHDPTPEDLAAHLILLQRLIADGDHLLSLLEHHGLPENAEEITPASVAATVELLRADYRGRHQPMPPHQRERILNQAFPDVP